MKKTLQTLEPKIAQWLDPLPDEFKANVWEALYSTEKAEVPFNEHASELRELFFWHQSPAGSMYWECIEQLTGYFEKNSKKKAFPLFQTHAAA